LLQTDVNFKSTASVTFTLRTLSCGESLAWYVYLLLSGYLYAGDIELTMRAEKESTINVNGEILTVRQPVKRINVGDELTYSAELH
jgi:hypothetical protein